MPIKRNPPFFVSFSSTLLCASSLSLLSLPANAYEVYEEDGASISANLEAVLGIYNSQESYAQSGTLDEGAQSWQEGYAKYGLSAVMPTGDNQAELFGTFNFVSSATWGEGDAAGWTNGEERSTTVEDAFIGWRSGSVLPGLGQDGLTVSAGSQNIVVGDGFLIAGDALSFGEEILEGYLDRGGAYYLAARKAFDETAVISIGGDAGLRSDLMWLSSDNPAQAKAELGVATLEHVTEERTLGFTFIDVLDTADDYAFLYPEREDTKVYSIRAQGNAGVDELFLAGQYAYQNSPNDEENAWYAEIGWTFSDVAWSPSVNYRFSRFSSGYDPLFYGNGRALGTWFQGEVAANYAGPFNSNTRVHHLGVRATPSEMLAVGALYYNFEPVDSQGGLDSGGNELDFYLEWPVSENLFIMPLIGAYKPDESLQGGGTQIGNDDTNIYTQLIVAFSF